MHEIPHTHTCIYIYAYLKWILKATLPFFFSFIRFFDSIKKEKSKKKIQWEKEKIKKYNGILWKKKKFQSLLLIISQTSTLPLTYAMYKVASCNNILHLSRRLCVWARLRWARRHQGKWSIWWPTMSIGSISFPFLSITCGRHLYPPW